MTNKSLADREMEIAAELERVRAEILKALAAGEDMHRLYLLEEQLVREMHYVAEAIERAHK